MATIETDPQTGAQIVADAKEHVLYSWSVQDAINPIALSCWRRGAPTSGTTTASATWTSPLSSSTSRSATSTRGSWPRSRSRPTGSARSARRWRRVTLTARPPARGGHAGDSDDVVPHERRRRGQRERDQARSLVHGPAQGDRALPLLPRREGGAITLTGDLRRWPAEPGLPESCGCSTRTRAHAAPPVIPTRASRLHGAPHLEEISSTGEGPDTVAAAILETITVARTGSSSCPTATCSRSARRATGTGSC